MQGVAFRRQHPVGPYILDFYCSAAKLAIELDGDQHAQQREYDEARTKFLNRMGIQMLRFWNIDLKENLEGVLDTIGARVLELTPTRSAARSDLPLSGGGVVHASLGSSFLHASIRPITDSADFASCVRSSPVSSSSTMRSMPFSPITAGTPT